jgi:flagellin-like protein
MKFMKEEDAVSPVIGVILMVAITVILAAVIAAFVFGMSGGVSKTKNVAVTVRQVGTDCEMTEQGGADFSALENITWTCGAVSGDPDTTPAIGNVKTATDGGTGASDHVIVIGNFKDGSSQVILDTYV